MIGRKVEPQLQMCSHLMLLCKLRTGETEWECRCEEEASTMCIKDGYCPIYPEMIKQLKKVPYVHR
jgi:hypothetical protein